MTDQQTFPAWLNIDAVVLSKHRDVMPTCVAAASDLVAAVLAFSDAWAPYLIDVEERAQGVLGPDLNDLAWEVLKTVGIFEVRERLGLARHIITRILDDDGPGDYPADLEAIATESQVALILWLEEQRGVVDPANSTVVSREWTRAALQTLLYGNREGGVGDSPRRLGVGSRVAGRPSTTSLRLSNATGPLAALVFNGGGRSASAFVVRLLFQAAHRSALDAASVRSRGGVDSPQGGHGGPHCSAVGAAPHNGGLILSTVPLCGRVRGFSAMDEHHREPTSPRRPRRRVGIIVTTLAILGVAAGSSCADSYRRSLKDGFPEGPDGFSTAVPETRGDGTGTTEDNFRGAMGQYHMDERDVDCMVRHAFENASTTVVIGATPVHSWTADQLNSYAASCNIDFSKLWYMTD